MTDQNTRMVLRTVYLPPDVDHKLRIKAFEGRSSKNDLIREAVTQYLGGNAKAAPENAPAECRPAQTDVGS